MTVELSPVGQALRPGSSGSVTRRPIGDLHRHALARANEVRRGVNPGTVRTVALAKKANTSLIAGGVITALAAGVGISDLLKARGVTKAQKDLLRRLKDKKTSVDVASHIKNTMPGVKVISSPQQLAAMMAREQKNPIKRVVQTSVLGQGLAGNNAFALRGEHGEYVVSSGKLPVDVINHELGHIRDFREKNITLENLGPYKTNLATLLWRPSFDARVMERELAAWRHTPSSRTKNKTMSSALSTYDKGFHMQRGLLATSLALLVGPQVVARALTKKASSASITAPGGGGYGPVPCLEGFGRAMTTRVKQQVSKLQRHLRPGDIINTNPRTLRGPGRAFKTLSRAVQGTPFGHSALYDGKGHVIEARGHTVVRRPLGDLARCNQITAVTPKGVSMADRKRAVSWMNQHVGNEGMRVTLTNIVMHGAKPNALSAKHERARQKIERAICSSLIANAYAHVPFNEKRRIADTRPVDILHSNKVKVVGKIK